MLPEGIPTVTVTGRFLTPDGHPLAGQVVFRAPSILTFGEYDVILGGPVVVPLDATGAFSVELPATDAPGVNPAGWSYTVAEQLVGVAMNRVYQVLLPAESPEVDLADIAPTDPTTPNYVAVRGDSAYEVAVEAGFVGTVTEWLTSLNGNVRNVLAYGAVGNGVADDLAAIEAALDDAYEAGGGVVYLPAGRTYGISDYLHIRTGTTVIAYGATVKGIANRGLAKLYAESDTAFTAYNGHSRIRIYGGIWDVNAYDGSVGTATAIVNGFLCGHNNDVIFRDVTVRDVSSGHGIDLVGCQNVKILNSRFEGFKDNTVDQSSGFREAVQLDFAVSGSGINGSFDGTPCRNILVQGSSFGASSRLGGFGRAVGSHSSYNATTWCDGVQILGCRIEATLLEGIRAYAWRNVVIADNVVSGTGSAGIIVTGPDPATAGYAIPCHDITIRSNVCGTAGGSSPLRVIGFATARPAGVSFIGNRVTGSGSTGIYVSQADAPQIAANKISACTSSSIYAINCTAPLITGNQCAGSGATSIGVDACTGGHVATNAVDGSASHGILISGGSSVSATGNRVVGAAGSGIRATSSTVRPRIIGNTILRNGVTVTWGLDVTASATDALIINNDLTGSAWAAGTAYNLVGTRQILDWTGAEGVTLPGQNLVS